MHCNETNRSGTVILSSTLIPLLPYYRSININQTRIWITHSFRRIIVLINYQTYQKSLNSLQFHPEHERCLSLLDSLRPACETFRHDGIAYFLPIPNIGTNSKLKIGSNPTNPEKKFKRENGITFRHLRRPLLRTQSKHPTPSPAPEHSNPPLSF